MGWFNEDTEQAKAYDQVTNKPQGASWSAELIADAASYEAAKKYEDYITENGHPPAYEQAKKILAAAAGAFIDREVETNGLNSINKEEAKQLANEQTEDALDKYRAISDPKKIISKALFEKSTQPLLTQEEGITLFKTPPDEAKEIEQLLACPPGTFDESYVKFVQGSENCASCGRHYSFLDVASTGVEVHGKEFLKDTVLGKFGYIYNYAGTQAHKCYKCNTVAFTPMKAYAVQYYGCQGCTIM